MLASRRSLLAALSVCGLMGPPGCKTLTPPPYPQGQAPARETLLAEAAPRLPAIQVPEARIRANRGIKGTLAFLAQAPDRFRGSVSVAGNEVASLAVHEQGYDLVYKLDALPPGYYSGPASECAVAALLGVAFDGETLVSVVLGGAPLLAGAEVVKQRWNAEQARETLHLSDGRHEQQLRFAPQGDTWRFTGATLWRREGADRDRLWTLEHERWHVVEGHVLPARTRISRPDGFRDQFVRIDYHEQNPEPEFAQKPASESAPAEAPDGEGVGDRAGGEGADDAASDPADAPAEDPWAEGGGQWEGAPGETPPQPEPEPEPEPEPAGETEVPALFRLRSGGLTERGDVCRFVR